MNTLLYIRSDVKIQWITCTTQEHEIQDEIIEILRQREQIIIHRRFNFSRLFYGISNLISLNESAEFSMSRLRTSHKISREILKSEI